MAGDGLQAGLFPDEMMNIHGYWSRTWAQLVRGLFFFWEGDYRPMGAFFCRPLFDAFGLRPFPYRLVCFGLLTANLGLAYRLAWQLAGSIPVAAFTALIFAYHAYLADLYYSSATIYDLLCFLFFALTLWLYVRWRGALTAARLAMLAALYWLALNAKEMALGLPVVVMAYELTRARRDVRFVGLSALLAMTSLAPRLLGAQALAGQAGYHPEPALMLQNLRHYLGLLFYIQGDLPLWASVAVCLAAVAVALWLRSPAAVVGAAMFVGLPLVLLPIPPRSLYVYYVPYFGWALLLACVLGRFTKERLWVPLLLLTALLLPAHRYRKPYGNAWVAADQAKVRNVVDQLREHLPQLPRGAHVLAEDDPFDADDWILTFIFRLHYRDETLQIGRRKAPTQPDLASLEPYGCRITLDGYRLRVLSGCATR